MKKIKVNDTEEKIIPISTSKVFTQKLTDYTPKCTLLFSIIFFIVTGIFFTAFGVAIVVETAKVKEIGINYTGCKRNESNYCTVSFTVSEEITSPLYIYYNLSSFYTNHRDFFTSKSFPQLRNSTEYEPNLNIKKCEGSLTNQEMFDYDSTKYFSYANVSLIADNTAWPCGLSAKAYFRDRFLLYKIENSTKKSIFINETLITTEYEREYAYINIPQSKDVSWVNVEDEHFIVWMHVESWKSFRKLWGRVSENIVPGEYEFEIYNSKSYICISYILYLYMLYLYMLYISFQCFKLHN